MGINHVSHEYENRELSILPVTKHTRTHTYILILYHANPGTDFLPVVNSVLMEHTHISEAKNVKVSIGNCFIFLVVIRILTQVSLSHSSFSSSMCPLPLPIALCAPNFPIPKERGKPKRGLTYYNFVARHHHLNPSTEPISPPITNVHPVGPSLNNSPCSIQNWLDNDKPMAYVEEEFLHAPPQAPTNSSLFSTSNILTSPHTYGKHSLESDCALETKNCSVKEEIPTTKQEEEAPPVGESQPTAASIPKTLSMWCLGAFATYLRNERGCNKSTSSPNYPRLTPEYSV